MSELPKGWVQSTIGEVAESMKNGIYKQKDAYADDGFACLRMYNIERGAIVWKDIKRMRLSDEELETYRLNPGDLLVNRVNSRELVGKTAVIPTGLEPCVYESKNIRLRLRRDIVEPKFVSLKLFLDGSSHFDQNAQQVVGMASISQPQIAAFPIPLPPLPEQRRIVARIEELFSRLDAGVAALRHAKAQLQRYRQSVLAAAVTGQLTQAWREQHGLTMKDWCQTTLGEESTLVTSGSRGWAKYYSDDGPLFIRAQNIKTDALVLDDLAHVRPPVGSEGARTQVFDNDLLITITGANVTKSARVETPLGEAYVSQHVALVRPLNPAHAPFLYYAIISPRNGRFFLEEKAYGAGKPGLNLLNVREVPVTLPPLAEQHQIVAEVESRTTAIDHLEAELNRQITRSNRLRQSSLAAAFSGQL